MVMMFLICVSENAYRGIGSASGASLRVFVLGLMFELMNFNIGCK